MNGYLVLETGEVYKGIFRGGQNRAGEVVFNTSHSGYEEMATDPSYYNQILLTTAPMQGNYGESNNVWESKNIWIQGFICLEMQNSPRDNSWLQKLTSHNVPILTDLDTRSIVLRLREAGTVWGAIVSATDERQAKEIANLLINEKKTEDKDWAFKVSSQEAYELDGPISNGVKVAVLDFGSKKNILHELQLRCEKVKVFPLRSNAEEIKSWQPHGIMLSNGPGDPKDVAQAPDTIKALLGWKPIFGICMGHQILSLVLGADTYRLKFGHRGSNHPIKDKILNKIYMTSQNHSYAVDPKTIPDDVEVTHINLNDGTIAGIRNKNLKCMSVQFHPESHPGPHDAVGLFDEFLRQLQ
ncbi:MAG: glutamine-hydrolyzing carbamoyl-phosphate synthase small subunit [Bdellovibrionales bacterium]|nr:glutamine-hydrolyzing carbamoyl-phosphate synthase small subunit [Bdellovibrionales bacterium]